MAAKNNQPVETQCNQRTFELSKHFRRRVSARFDGGATIRCDFAAIDELLVDLYLEAEPDSAEPIILDLDATDPPLHGRQEGRFFHGYHGLFRYLPLYIFAGDDLPCARQRTANQDAAAGSLAEVERIVEWLRARRPRARILVRADSCFCRDELPAWCEENRVDYVVGLARNERLHAMIEPELAEAAAEQAATGRAARRVWLSLSEAWPWRRLFETAWRRLCAEPPAATG